MWLRRRMEKTGWTEITTNQEVEEQRSLLAMVKKRKTHWLQEHFGHIRKSENIKLNIL